MKTLQWEHERIGTGKYRVRLDRTVVPGIVIGGNGIWLVQVEGNQIQERFPTIADAAEWLVRREIGI
tara:strand:+ start:1857 stop:2057 length:201 start_codon:yes stop_codon:yes gene_type:complete